MQHSATQTQEIAGAPKVSPESSRGRRGPYAKTVRTRERIIDACEALYASKGFRATTVKEIAALAGISDRGLVHHFPSRDDLLFAVLERHEKRSSDAIVHDDPYDVLRAILAQEESLSRDPHLAELRTVISAEAIDPAHPAHEHYRGVYEQWSGFLTDLFRALERRGDLAEGADPAGLAASVIALTDGLQLQRLYGIEGATGPSILPRLVEDHVPALRTP